MLFILWFLRLVVLRIVIVIIITIVIIIIIIIIIIRTLGSYDKLWGARRRGSS